MHSQDQRETECVNAHTQFDFSHTVQGPAEASVLCPLTLGFPTSISICMTVRHIPTGQPDLNSVSLRFSSQVSLDHVTLTTRVTRHNDSLLKSLGGLHRLYLHT